MANLFIVLEGIDGSGKGEMMKRLEQHYSKKYKVLATGEPTDGRYGKEIRKLLKEETDPLSNKEKLLELYIKDREEHLKNQIIPFLKDGQGKILFCDRYYYSTIVYQNAQGIPINDLIESNKLFKKPDICFILDAPAELALKRIIDRGKEEKFEQLEFMKKLRKRFLELKSRLNDKIMIIDASKRKEEVFDKLKQEIDAFMQNN